MARALLLTMIATLVCVGLAAASAPTYVAMTVRPSDGSATAGASLPPGSGTLVGLSPDRSTALLRRDGDLWLQPFAGGTATRVEVPPQWDRGGYDGTQPFSPDGTHIAAGVGVPQCGLLACAAVLVYSTVERSSLIFADSASATWSPTGRSLAFVSDLADAESGAGVLVVVRPDGTGRRILAHDAYWGPIAYSPTGGSIAYGCKRGLCTVSLQGREHTYRTRTSVWGPVWSPNGKEVAFSLGSDGINHELLAVAELAGSVRVLTHTTINGDVDTPLAWSPDSGTLLFQRTCEAPKQYCATVVEAQSLRTGARKRLSHDDSRWLDARWRPGAIDYVAGPPR